MKWYGWQDDVHQTERKIFVCPPITKRNIYQTLTRSAGKYIGKAGLYLGYVYVNEPL